MPSYASYVIVLMMEGRLEFISGGGITSPAGFCAGATCAGIKEESRGKLDLAILLSDNLCTAAGVFTTNRVRAAPVLLTRQRLQKGRSVALVVNSGCANAVTGEGGMADAVAMADMVAKKTGLLAEDVLVASTGVIGERLPMEKIRAGISGVALSGDGGHQLARAIMTTDTVPKEVAVRVDDGQFSIGGVAKGSGMIHPDLATLLCFLTTDACVEPDFLREAMQRAVDVSFNMVSIDGDTSPNDMVLIMANGMAGNEPLSSGSSHADTFQQALNQVCVHLAKAIARDGEGASRMIEVTVKGAANQAEARVAARTVVSSPLVKAAVYGKDPNWGRVIAAAGRSGVEISETEFDLYFGDVCLVKSGHIAPFDSGEAVKALSGSEVSIILNLNLGSAAATAWGCDLTEEYVVINSQYTT